MSPGAPAHRVTDRARVYAEPVGDGGGRHAVSAKSSGLVDSRLGEDRGRMGLASRQATMPGGVGAVLLLRAVDEVQPGPIVGSVAVQVAGHQAFGLRPEEGFSDQTVYGDRRLLSARGLDANGRVWRTAWRTFLHHPAEPVADAAAAGSLVARKPRDRAPFFAWQRRIGGARDASPKPPLPGLYRRARPAGIVALGHTRRRNIQRAAEAAGDRASHGRNPVTLATNHTSAARMGRLTRFAHHQPAERP